MDDQLMISRIDHMAKIIAVVAILVFVVTINIEEPHDVNLVDKRARLALDVPRTFKIVSNLTSWKYFIQSVSDFVAVDEKPIGIGKQYVESTYIPIFGYSEYKCQILSYDPPQHISYICDDILRSRVSIDLSHDPEVGTHPTVINYKVDSRRRSKFFKEYASKVIMLYEDAQITNALHTLQHHISVSKKTQNS